MATTTKKKNILGLSAAELSGFIMSNSAFADCGHIGASVSRSGICADVRKISELIGQLGLDDRLIAQGLEFTKTRKSADGKWSLFDDILALAGKQKESMDLGWVTPTFPRVMAILDHTHPDRGNRSPIPAAPVFLVYSFPDTDPVNTLLPGHKLFAFVLVLPEFASEGDVVDQCARSRAFTMMANSGNKCDFSFLAPRVKLAKVSFQLVAKHTEASLNWFFPALEKADASKLWPLIPCSSAAAPIMLPAFTADELDIGTWRTRLLESAPNLFNNAYRMDGLFAPDTHTSPTKANMEAILSQTTKQKTQVFEAAAKAFPSNAKELAPVAGKVTPDAARLLYKLLRYANCGGVGSPPAVQDTLSDGNIIIR